MRSAIIEALALSMLFGCDPRAERNHAGITVLAPTNHWKPNIYVRKLTPEEEHAVLQFSGYVNGVLTNDAPCNISAQIEIIELALKQIKQTLKQKGQK